jgi:hypothetical protein
LWRDLLRYMLKDVRDFRDGEFIEEPWWEALKHAIQTRNCIGCMWPWVHNNERAASDIRHAVCSRDDTGSQAGYMTDSGSTESSRKGGSISYSQSRDSQEDTDMQTGYNTDYDTNPRDGHETAYESFEGGSS